MEGLRGVNSKERKIKSSRLYSHPIARESEDFLPGAGMRNGPVTAHIE